MTDRRALEILESITEGFLSLDQEWRFTYLNPAACRILGRSPGELLGQLFFFGGNGEVVAIAGTTRDVTERQRAEQEIRDLVQRLTEADRAKDEFLATLSHELRNPLAPLRNSLHLLRKNAGGAAVDTRRVHEMMERQVNHLVRLVDDLLEISRISRGAFELRKTKVEVAAIVRNAIETSQPLIEAAGHELKTSLPPEPLWLDGDPVRLAQILANLLNNASKYTPPGGHLEVTVRREHQHAVIGVRDDGAGIAPAALPGLFQMFSRGDRSSGLDQSGLGVGLALARRLAEMHGGSLEAQSSGLKQGSEFTVRLPLAPALAPQESVAEQPEPKLPPRRVLVVDDNRDAGDSLALVLSFLGAEVRVARDGPEALETFSTYSPSMVLLDIGMPGMDGYEVARTIRQRFPERSPALVALTSWGQLDDRRLAREAGFDRHLIKPAEIDTLQSLLASLGD
jgi:signal transduction histidine kinase